MITKQADGRFLHAILLLLILATLASGTIAMVKAQGMTSEIASQP